MLKIYTYVWILITVILAYEWYALNFDQSSSITAYLQNDLEILQVFKLDPSPGKTISLYYGWIGFSIMCLTNLYIIRKRFSVFQKIGKNENWLNFHIFCGLVGPTFILFHTNFKVGGLVAISFWSMVISFASGIVGKYFYSQVTKHESDLLHEAEKIEMNIDKVMKDPQWKITPEKLVSLKTNVMRLAGVRAFDVHTSLPVLKSLWHSITGDMLLRTRFTTTAAGFPPSRYFQLREFALIKRRIVYWEEFRRLMGYWHSFHVPFAIFMYIVAIIHIATALLFMV